MSLRHMRLVESQEKKNESKLDDITIPVISSLKKSNKQKEKERKKKAELAEYELLKQLELEEEQEEYISSEEELSNEQHADSDKEHSDEEDDHLNNSKNPFDMLHGDKEEHTDDHHDDDSDDSDESSPEVKATPVVMSSSARKRMNRKNKALAKDQIKEETDETEDIDAITKEVFGNDYVPQKIEDNNSNLLNVTVRHLCFHAETNKKFGKKNVRDVAPIKRDSAHVNYMRSGIFIKPMDEWPKFINSGIRMVVDNKPTHNYGGKYFIFIHDKAYQKKQFQFFDAADTFNRDNIVDLMHKNPYHLDTLLQVSEISLMAEDRKTAAEFIYRAVYVMERAFHSTFDMASGDCHLDFTKRENRTFYIVMYRHMNFISNLSCYRTALEICKLIYSLDRTDPMGILLIMDNIALMAKKYKFVANMYEDNKHNPELEWLPNWNYSMALSYYARSTFKRIPKVDRQKLKVQADLKLKEALLKFPGLFLILCKACYIKVDPSISNHVLFKGFDVPGLMQLYTLYAARSHGNWKIKHTGTPDWLVSTAMEAMRTYDQDKDKHSRYINSVSEMFVGLPPRNVHRHIMISEFDEVRNQLPSYMRRDSILSYDPLPPKNSILGYKRPPKKAAPTRQISSGYRAFFQSMMPNMTVEDIIALATNQDMNPADLDRVFDEIDLQNQNEGAQDRYDFD